MYDPHIPAGNGGVMDEWRLIPPDRRTPWQKAGEACQVLLVTAGFMFIGWLALRVIWLIL